MGEDPAVTRAARYAAFGQATDPPPAVLDELQHAAIDDADARARASALAALVRVGGPDTALRSWARASVDADPVVRRRAADLGPTIGARSPDAVVDALLRFLGDDDVSVIEAAAWALGELGDAAVTRGAVPTLAATTTGHPDALAREAAVAALGALGDPDGLPAVLVACRDATAVRRRAVLALAPFEGPDVDTALETAAADRDWQVRQAAEDLLTPS